MNTKIIVAGIAVVILLGIIAVVINKGSFKNNSMNNDQTEFARADALIQQVEKKQGLKNGPLDTSLNQVAYGTLLLRYIPERHTIEVAILIEKNGLYKSLGKEREVAYLKATAALSDPKIGGMFDTRGALWRFDKDTGETFLYKEYSLDTDAKVISDELNSTKEVVPNWGTTWMLAVARIVHGHEPAPTQPVTRENDPYKDKL